MTAADRRDKQTNLYWVIEYVYSPSVSAMPSEERCQYVRSLCLACSPFTSLRKGPHKLDCLSKLQNRIGNYTMKAIFQNIKKKPIKKAGFKKFHHPNSREANILLLENLKGIQQTCIFWYIHRVKSAGPAGHHHLHHHSHLGFTW